MICCNGLSMRQGGLIGAKLLRLVERLTMASNLLNFLRDSQAQSEIRNALADAANRGMVAGSLGAPVDMATTLTNLLIAGGGYAGHKAGLLSQPPELIDSRNVPGSSRAM